MREVEEVYDVDDEVRFCCILLHTVVWSVLHRLSGFHDYVLNINC